MLQQSATTLAMTAHAGTAVYLALILGARVIAETLYKSTAQPSPPHRTLRADPLWEQVGPNRALCFYKRFSARPASSSEHLATNTIE